MIKDFLPINREDMKDRGWDEVDFVYVLGDAYVDHPSFGPAIISRILEANNYRVGDVIDVLIYFIGSILGFIVIERGLLKCQTKQRNQAVKKI